MAEKHDAADGAANELARFVAAVERDRRRYIASPALLKWLFIDRQNVGGRLADMNFYGFHGKQHLEKFFKWQQKPNLTDYLPDELMDPLATRSLTRDESSLSRLNLAVPRRILEGIARYNAEDYVLQRFYPVPDVLRPRAILDFGAGYGRTVNLSFGAADNVTQMFIAVDGIPGPYLTQRVYFEALQLDFDDYIDHPDSFEVLRHGAATRLIHLPTWRLDLVPDDAIDLICCIQVLKEIPGEVLLFALGHFARILKPRGALFIRDHEQYHHPNQMPIDELLLSLGFVLEFRPILRDYAEMHGLPRIWRKLDASRYLEAETRAAARQSRQTGE